jgi:hypothetical protein
MELEMSIPEGLFPQPLVNHLGAYSRLDSLLALPEISSSKGIELCRFDEEEPYHVELEAHGMTLTLQCINPEALHEQQKWGLQGLTLNARAASGQWLEGRKPALMKANDVLDLFQIAPEDEKLLNMHPMLCFAMAGPSNQSWSLVARFEQRGAMLTTLSLMRVGEWREMPLAEGAPAITTLEHKPTTTQPTMSVITCRSGEPAPETGVWEGRLPPDHPQTKVFDDVPHRFVFKRHGDPMGPLGLPPFDEAMVVWTWLRSQ